MFVPETPFVLHLPNVMHLATDVTGVMSNGASALTLAASLHPSAAVGGTPTADAVRLIDEIELLDRGRYAGPVGWIDARGDGEWGIGLRSAQIEGDGAHRAAVRRLRHRRRLGAGRRAGRVQRQAHPGPRRPHSPLSQR